MSSFASSPYVSVMEHGEAVQLSGTEASHPLKAGQMIVGHGTFDDATETGARIFLVLRDMGNHIVMLHWPQKQKINGI